MRTGDLIEAIAADARSRRTPPGPALLGALAVGGALAAALQLATIGIRPDVAAALATLRFPVKFIPVLVLAAAALALLTRMARPGADGRAAALALLAFPALLAAGVAAELAAVPREAWLPLLVGKNAAYCLTVVPLLGLAPLAALLLALRRAAPTRPTAAGAVTGLAAGALAAFFYGWHCTDDSPLFVATWYPLAIAVLGAGGALAGRALLRW